MTNEIKEILDYLKNQKMYAINEFGAHKELTPEENNKLLDYITNLQEIEKEHQKINGELRQEINDLQEEKENAVESLKYYEEKHFIKPVVDNMKLTTELYNAYSKEINDLQQRIDKAIEYVEKHKRKDGFLNLNEWQTRDLLDILRGDK